MENPIKIHDLGVPLFLETPIYGLKHLNDIWAELCSFPQDCAC